MYTVFSLLAQVDLRETFILKDGTPVSEVYSTPASLINAWLPNVYYVSGTLLLGLLVFGGFSIIASGGDTKATEKGSKAITGALAGFAIMVTAYWIIQVLELATGLKILTPQ